MSRPALWPSRPIVFDLCMAGSVVVAAGELWLSVQPGGLVYGCLVGCALMWRRRRPVLTFVAVSLVTAAILAGTVDTRLHEAGPAIGLGAALYAVVCYARTLYAGVLAGVAAVIVGATTSVQIGVLFADSASDPKRLADAVLSNLLVAVGVGSVALLARTRRLHLLGLEERAAVAERERDHLARIAVAEERARIARELHDIVAHSLSVMVVHANGAEYALERDPERVRAALRTISTTGQDALGEIKQLVQILRSDDGDPAVDGPPAGLDQVGAVVERARGAGLTVDLVVDGIPPRVPGGIALAVYRIVQEALTNTLKHAGPASTATVQVSYGTKAIEVVVTNTGAGPAATAPGGHGLVGMRERVNLYGGVFDAGPSLGGGWRVRASIPLATSTSTSTDSTDGTVAA